MELEARAKNTIAEIFEHTALHRRNLREAELDITLILCDGHLLAKVNLRQAILVDVAQQQAHVLTLKNQMRPAGVLLDLTFFKLKSGS